MTWEPLDAPTQSFAVVATEDYSLDPLAIFRNRASAEDWIDYKRNRVSEDERINVDLTIVEIRRLSGIGWNSLEEPPPVGDEMLAEVES